MWKNTHIRLAMVTKYINKTTGSSDSLISQLLTPYIRFPDIFSLHG